MITLCYILNIKVKLFLPFPFRRRFRRSSPFVKLTKLPDRFVLARNNHLRQREIPVLKACRLHLPTELFGDFDLVLPEHLKLRFFEPQTLPSVRHFQKNVSVRRRLMGMNGV